ncbi:MAG: hypothetical protein FJW31_25655 [Acidobacteria bacterium]|nr:hypothetical protein [Acidobacteriota bacterium]
MRPILVGLGLLAGGLWAQKKPVSLEAVTATPARGPAAPVWSPDSKRFLTVTGTQLSLYDVAAKSQRDLLDLKKLDDAASTPPPSAAFAWENRGVAEQPVQWSADGTQVLLARQGEVFLLDVASGAHRQLTKTKEAERDPKLAPNAKSVAFRVAHDLYVMDVASGKTKPLTKGGTSDVRNAELDWVYPEELAVPTAYWWSPDSRRIAYLQFDQTNVPIYPHGDVTQVRPVSEPQRYAQAGTENAKVRLGLVAAGGGATKWVDLPELEGRLIARVDWLPDSSALAVALLNRVQNELRWVRVGGRSAAVTLYEQKDPAWINFTSDYRFLSKSTRLLMTAERPDFRHLYLVDIAQPGAAPKAVTQGKWEVTALNCVDEAGEWIYYTTSETSPLERHLYRVKFDGSAKQQLTQGRGTHNASMPAGCGAFVDSHSSLVDPPRRSLHDGAGAVLAVLSERDTKVASEYEILPTELVRFRGADGAEFHARLIKPAGFDPAKKYPAIVQVYGGPHAQSVRDMWKGADFDQYLAHRGVVIWQVDNRGSAGRGHLWESKLYRRFGKQELEDQVEGVKHLLSLGFVDPARVGINGWSYGGFMTLYGLFNAPQTFAAGIAGAAVTDWRNYDTIYTERYLGLPQQNEDGYKASSPVFQAGQLKGKLMLIHNFEDDNVLFQHALRMSDALQQAGRPFEFMLYPQKAHGVTGVARRHMLEAQASFWERHLKP